MANYVHFERGKEFVTLADKDFYNTDEVTSGILPTSLEIVARPSGGEGKCAKLIDLAAQPRTKSCRMSTMLIAIINGLIERLYFYARPAKAAAGFVVDTHDHSKRIAWSSMSDDDFRDYFSLVDKLFDYYSDFRTLLTACAPHDSVPHIMGELTKDQTRGYSYKWCALATLAFEAMRERGDADLSMAYYASADATKPVITILPPGVEIGRGRDSGYANDVASNNGYFTTIDLCGDYTVEDLMGLTHSHKIAEGLGRQFGHLLPINYLSGVGYDDPKTDFASVLESACSITISAGAVRGTVRDMSVDGFNFCEGAWPNYTGTGNPDIAKVWMVRNLATTGDAGDDGRLAPLQDLLDQALLFGQINFGLSKEAWSSTWQTTSEVSEPPVALAFALSLLFKGESAATYCMRMHEFALAANAVAIARWARYLMFDVPCDFDDKDGNADVKRLTIAGNRYDKTLQLQIKFADSPGSGSIKDAIINCAMSRDLFTLAVDQVDALPTSKLTTHNEMRWEYSETQDVSMGDYNFSGIFSADLNPAAYRAKDEFAGVYPEAEWLFARGTIYQVDVPGSIWDGIKVQSLSVIMGNVLHHKELFDVTDKLDGVSSGSNAAMRSVVTAQFPAPDDNLFAARTDGLDMLAFNGASDDHRAPAYGDAAALLPSETTYTLDGYGTLVTMAAHASPYVDIFATDKFRDDMQFLVKDVKTHGEEHLFADSEVYLDPQRLSHNNIREEVAAQARIKVIIDKFAAAEDKVGRNNLFAVSTNSVTASFDPSALNAQYLGIFIAAEDFVATDGTTYKSGDILTCVISATANLSSACFNIDTAAGTCELLGSSLPGSHTITCSLSGAASFSVATKDVLGEINTGWQAVTVFSHVIGKVKTNWRNLWISESKHA